jgi:hypothetical protein
MDMKKTEIKSGKIVPAAIYLLLVVFLMSVSVQAGTIQLPKGTKVKLKFPSNIKITSGNLSQGLPILCRLAEPVEVGGIVVVEEGAQGTATVLEVEPAKKGGKPGSIKIGFTALETKGEYKTIDDNPIKLFGTKEAKGKGKGIFPYLFFIFFVKGSEGVIPTNAVYTVEVAESIVLQSP